MKTLTYGNLPTREEFGEAFEREVPRGVYTITHGMSTPAGSERPAAGDYNERQLWTELERLTNCEGFDETDGGEWASDILSTLGFEWV